MVARVEMLNLQHRITRRQAALSRGGCRSRSMICPPLPPSPLIVDWIDRHRNPASFVLHMFGILPTILGVLLIPVYVTLMSVPIFLLALALFVGGYLVQFL